MRNEGKQMRNEENEREMRETNPKVGINLNLFSMQPPIHLHSMKQFSVFLQSVHMEHLLQQIIQVSSVKKSDLKFYKKKKKDIYLSVSGLPVQSVSKLQKSSSLTLKKFLICFLLNLLSPSFLHPNPYFPRHQCLVEKK